ncbi:hypothetical protein V5097_07455 [Arenibacter palladensis]|uniref:hypothetical protein n=1 Tax=Arenibacter palladensis TaxID=237373 RepID=UPI002FCE78BF
MKNFGKLFYASLFFSCSMSLLAVTPGHGNYCSNTITELVDEVYKSPIGTWEYTVTDVPYEYSAGVLIITKEKNEYKVLVKVNNNTLTASDVKVNDDKVNFSVYIEGGKVQVSLQVKDDVLNGNANSSEGSFSLKGKKK